MDMESRTKAQAHSLKGFKAFIGKTEKQCNKCGFVTFCLHVLHKHKYKCRGQLLGHPIICVYCKRKFNFVTPYKSHKATCVKKFLRQKYLASRLKKTHLKCKGTKRKHLISSSFSLSCPICKTSFTSKNNFVSHLVKQNCELQRRTSFSARKSFNNQKRSKSSSICKDKFYLSDFDENNHSTKDRNAQLRCVWCKSSYPSAKLLLMHLDMSDECAIAYYQTDTINKKMKASLTARKTMSVVAKKSFSHKKFSNAFNYQKVNRSARKTLPASRRKSKSYKNSSSENLTFNPCPVCYKEFPDSFSFFLHQKKMNHWGKATKSITSTSKCPFCEKVFLHVASRIAHIHNHNDVSEDKIKAYLRNHTCSICSQVFATELTKQQHMRIHHPAYPTSVKSSKYTNIGPEHNTSTDSDYKSKQKMSSVPSAVKKKLKQQPNTCPVCSKAFSHTVLRNKHFNEVHLKIFECQFCNTKFKSISSLNNHIELSHGKDFECRECKIKFKNELQLLQHVLKSHPNKDPKLFLPVKSKSISPKEKQQDPIQKISVKSTEKVNSRYGLLERNMEYYCDVCDIGYLKLCGLQRHRQSKLHKDTLEKNLDAVHKSLSDLPPPSSNPPKVAQPEILTCSECSEDFASVKDFVPHRLSHFSVQSKYLKITELNPYMCEICSDVLDSHSKVQLHLFWHLQIESTASSNINVRPSKKETIVPDRLSGQHVAKKSFSKQNHESFQEVVIGGVKKALFTCKDCNIGFTAKEHYSVHVRKLCKKRKTSNTLSVNEESSHVKKISNSAKMDNYVHCGDCNFLFISPAKHEQHKLFCSKCVFDRNSEENSCNSDAIKSSLKLDISIAGCVTCGAIFDSVLNIEEHINIHKEDGDNSITEDVPEDVLHCALCNCLFPLHAFKSHKDFCKIPTNIGDKVTNSKHMNVLKSALELKCAVAGCISCGVPFDDLETFENHLTLHQTNQIQNKLHDRNLCNGGKDPSIDNPSEFLLSNMANNFLETDEEHAKNFIKTQHVNNSLKFDEHVNNSLEFDEEHVNNSLEFDEEHVGNALEFDEHVHNSLEFDKKYANNSLESDEEHTKNSLESYGEHASNSLESSEEHGNSPLKSGDEQKSSNRILDYTSDSSTEKEKNSLYFNNDADSIITELRKNFSQLLCLLISDPELMQTLGYGKLFVEEVLVNVLEQMEQEPCNDESVSNLEKFRNNIQTFLDLCLKDQILEAIGNKKTIDEIVIEALKIFSSDERMFDTEEINVSV